MPLAFVRRLNLKEEVDSICTVCFATVCRAARTLILAKECEDAHECPGPSRYKFQKA